MSNAAPAGSFDRAGDYLADARERVFDAYRRWGYLEADLDPLGFFRPPMRSDLPRSGEIASEARAIYCGSIGADFMHIADADVRRWVAEQMEAPSPTIDSGRVLQRLIGAEAFEQVLQARYVGTRRYSLEGLAALVPLLDHVLDIAAAAGAKQVMLAMSHRGRLNVMVHVVGKPAADIFAKFEDVDPASVLGSGDVKYHIGATGEYGAAGGEVLAMHLVSNPSHLEAVDPVAIGRARAKQARLETKGAANSSSQIVPVVIHGDAAFAGQGIWAETLNFAGVTGYSVGGTIHIVANNLLGYTAGPTELHTSPFASDLAKRQAVPVFHVNGEDLDAVVRTGQIAARYRAHFASDVVVDLIGFRRHGHSELDDPTVTQPRLYAKIKEHPPLGELYAKRIGVNPAPLISKVREELQGALLVAREKTEAPVLRELPDYWSDYERGCYDAKYEVDTGVDVSTLGRIGGALTVLPERISVHPKVKKLLEERLEMANGRRPVDYGMAEALAFGTLLAAGTPVRLSGQDSVRGTFNQRHAAIVDVGDESRYVPLEHVAPNQARCEIYNSPLSEAGILGFEYGYSRDYPEALVMWEAQFGDFANGAQVIIDQFISAAEDKWDLPSGVVLLLPHGYEGQGPEHSSARVERYLQLAAEDNIQICQPSTAAQYFHLLRRQALRKWLKPLVVFTPKSMLRNPLASSSLAAFSTPRFLNVVPDLDIEEARRIILCSGKVGHELRREHERRDDHETAIVFLDQLYPFPAAELMSELMRHPDASEIVWVQEEPANMGALFYVLPRIEDLAGVPVRSVKRSASASPATGSGKAHEMEQRALIELAFATAAN